MKIAEIMEPMDKEKKDALEKLICRSIHEIGCDGIEWTEFIVADKSVKKLKMLLEKSQVQYILAAALKVSVNKGVLTTEINVIETDATFDEISYCRDRDRLMVFIFLSRETKKFLK